VALEKLSAKTFNFYAPRFRVKIEDEKLPPNIAMAIIDVSVDEKLDEGASFTMTIYDEFDMKSQTFKWLDHKLFNVGNKVAIEMGYENDLHTMVMGNITRIEPNFSVGETPTITIGGQDLSYDYLKRATPERTFVDKSYSDIVETIAKEAGMEFEVDTTGKYNRHLRKDSQTTYYAFIKDLAEKSGYIFYVDRKTIYFVKPKDDRKEVIKLTLGKDIINFRPLINTARQVTEVEVRGHNPRDPGTPLIGIAKAGEERNKKTGQETGSQITQKRHGSVKKVITNVIVNSVEHAKLIALAELNKASDTFITGEGECVGIPAIRPGVTIELEKMGTRFGGKYYVKGVKHTIGNNGYRTNFSVTKNSTSKKKGAK